MHFTSGTQGKAGSQSLPAAGVRGQAEHWKGQSIPLESPNRYSIHHEMSFPLPCTSLVPVRVLPSFPDASIMLLLVILLCVFFVLWAILWGLQSTNQVAVKPWMVSVCFFAMLACIVLILAGKERVFE